MNSTEHMFSCQFQW